MFLRGIPAWNPYSARAMKVRRLIITNVTITALLKMEQLLKFDVIHRKGRVNIYNSSSLTEQQTFLSAASFAISKEAKYQHSHLVPSSRKTNTKK
jgi:hypothetical protein